MRAPRYLGIDPGREKFGWALCDEKGAFFWSGIGVRQSFALWIRSAAAEGGLAFLEETLLEKRAPWEKMPGVPLEVVLGEGTGASFFSRTMEEQEIAFFLADEKNTTLQARGLYWELHPPRGFRRFFPRTMCVPPRPIDDLAALCILRRACCGEKRCFQS